MCCRVGGAGIFFFNISVISIPLLPDWNYSIEVLVLLMLA
jgi:hypothetical protein